MLLEPAIDLSFTIFTLISADCAIHIVCIFGLTGEVFSQTYVSGN